MADVLLIEAMKIMMRRNGRRKEDKEEEKGKGKVKRGGERGGGEGGGGREEESGVDYKDDNADHYETGAHKGRGKRQIVD